MLLALRLLYESNGPRVSAFAGKHRVHASLRTRIKSSPRKRIIASLRTRIKST